jgi:hypothetical protein
MTVVLLTSKMSVNDASRIVIDDPRVMLQIMTLLTDNSRIAIYDRNMLIVQATVLISLLWKIVICKLFSPIPLSRCQLWDSKPRS